MKKPTNSPTLSPCSLSSKNPFYCRINTTLISGCRPLKLNCKKLPGDFFGESAKTSRRSKKKASTERKKDANLENYDDIIPEAQVTSFFKMADISSSTHPASPEKPEKFMSERKLILEET